MIAAMNVSEEYGCTPYTYIWTYATNSTNATLKEMLDSLISMNTAVLNIPPGYLDYGSDYNFTVSIRNINGVINDPILTHFTTLPLPTVSSLSFGPSNNGNFF